MYELIFGKYPQVKVINYVLINPERSYTKKQIAVGANISRVTLDSFINDLVELDIFNKEGLTYFVNTDSKIVKILIKTQITLAELIMNDELDKSEEIMGEALTDEEFDKFLDTFDFEVDMDAEIEKIESDEISITKNEFPNLIANSQKIVSSNNMNKDVTFTKYIDHGYNKGSINYG